MREPYVALALTIRQHWSRLLGRGCSGMETAASKIHDVRPRPSFAGCSRTEIQPALTDAETGEPDSE